MLKLTLKPGDFIDIGDEVKVIFSGGSANNIHLLVDAPKNMNIARSSAGKHKTPSPYYREKDISEEAKKEITAILMREKKRQMHAG
ncbi:MAG: carbon storage regulator [Eubacterium sp.]|jgi:carbon storage regulator|nr:carbon storage regulator [Eubacterium sp.]